MRRFFPMVMFVCALIALPPAASAQDVGVRGGVSAQPDQFFVGLHVVTRPLFDRVVFRPNVEAGFGDGLTLIAINGEFVYRQPINRQPWSLIVGGGPGAVIRRYDKDRGGRTDSGPGLNLLAGLEHSGGFFAEVKAGFIDSPAFKFTLGFTFR